MDLAERGRDATAAALHVGGWQGAGLHNERSARQILGNRMSIGSAFSFGRVKKSLTFLLCSDAGHGGHCGLE